jgi:serine/threonine protein kinase
MSTKERKQYQKVIKYFHNRTKHVDWSYWHLFDEGLEGKLYIDSKGKSALKVMIVSLDEDPITRFEMIEAVNMSASNLGISPKVYSIFYTLKKNVLLQCIEQEFFEGVRFDTLPKNTALKIMPLIMNKIKCMIKNKIIHNDLHGGNILVSPDFMDIKFIDFSHGCIDFNTSTKLLCKYCLRKII